MNREPLGGGRDKSLELKCVERVFLAKIDLFMEHHVIPFCNPNDIYWWFSVSGGKDSFAMVNGIQKWYDAHKICLNSTVFHIDQWGGPAATSIEKYFEGYNLRIINGQLLTRRTIQYEHGQQAQCRQCADVR
jgi:tRNA(Ile)-lysidine synthase TilS/MesJ